MVEFKESAGHFRNGVPYNRLGHGARTLIVFQGLQFEHKPLTGLSARLMLNICNHPGKGLAPAGKQSGLDVLAFLRMD